ncbi:protein FAM217B isoform X2 [Nothoprocta perdicaria]|uniref:protein FAM217B isoform X2 n=1 Tax=Nothoprocta perdicaria TaxID=30464 RepID=UPI000E1BC051|nr:protein FAM217B isoform X2 [Nothoprocta perdicaria]
MGPGIQEYPLLLHRGTQKKGSQINETHKGMVNGGKSHLNTKGLKKQISHVRSAGRLDRNISSATEKISHDTKDDNQPSIFYKERNHLDDNIQPSRMSGACTSLHRVQGSKRSVPERRQSVAELHRIPPNIRGISQRSFSKSKDVPMQRFYCSEKKQSESSHKKHVAEATPCSSKWQEASVDEMLLDFESVQIIKEDAEDDSASDLSDSERIPIPPSPCTPPELILRAEEIDPVCLEHILDTGFKESEYYYPDFLPPPFNSWDLKQLSIFVHVEGKYEFRPKPAGFLEKYVDRLLQLEWLQMQTVQNEKGKAAKARPQTAPSSVRPLKSSGKGKALHSPLPTRQAAPQESITKLPTNYSGHRRDSYCEENRQLHAPPGHLRPSERIGYAVASERQSGEVRSELRRRPTAKQQLLSLQPSENSSKMQGIGNIRPPKQSPVFHASAAPIKGLKTYACTNPKKNGNASNCVPSKKTTGDRKMKTNGTKQTSRKFK